MLYSFVRPAIEFSSKAVSPNHRSIGNGIKWVQCEIQYQMNSEIDTIEPANKSTLRNETNGDDNYAIISFILVDTNSLSATHPCRPKRYSATAMYTHTDSIFAIFPTVYWITLSSPITIISISISFILLLCTLAVFRFVGMAIAQKAVRGRRCLSTHAHTDTNYAGQLQLGIVCNSAMVIIMSKIVTSYNNKWIKTQWYAT